MDGTAKPGERALSFCSPSFGLKRPRSSCGVCSNRNIRPLRYQSRNPSTRMDFSPSMITSSGDSAVVPLPQTPTGNIFPPGAFTVLLNIRFRQEFSIIDQKTILSEYGRRTCAEDSVLRCDILYDVNSRNLARDNFYEIWTTFKDSRAYTDHERTTHASKLRLCLENPSGGDNSVLLPKLSFHLSVLRPIRPDIGDWRSAFEYSNEGSEGIRRFHESSRQPSTVDNMDAESSEATRRSLNMLISSVGLENVTVLICTATARCFDSSRNLRAACENYLTNLEKSAGIVRTGLLVDRNDPYRFVLLTIHDASDDDGACFDMDLGLDFVTEDEWTVRRCFAVFPDKGGWEKRVDESEDSSFERDGVTVLTPEKAGLPSAGPTKTSELDHSSLVLSTNSRSASVTQHHPEPHTSKLRLLQGPGAFDSIKKCLREMTRIPEGDVRVMIVNGWNSSRIHDLLVQLEYDNRNDPGVIEYMTEFKVETMNVSTERFQAGVGEARKFRPDVVLGYGGGSVMDMAKFLSMFAKVQDNELQQIVDLINDGAEQGKDSVHLQKPSEGIPVMLIPTTIGSGAELIEACILTGRRRNGRRRRIPVYVDDELESTRGETEKTVIVDSRLVSPRRLDGLHAAQGALQLVCLGVDTLVSAHGQLDEQYVKFALEGISLAFKKVIPALREPRNATGQSRDALVQAKTAIGLARDGTGRMGICLRLCLGVIDSLIDGRYPTMFRMVLIRTTISVVDELCKMRDTEGQAQILVLLKQVMEVEREEEVARQLLSKAEDCNVSLLKDLGMVKRRIPGIAESVAASFKRPDSNHIEQMFADPKRLERILMSAVDQEYEL